MTLILPRRSFLTGLLGLVAAPAIVRLDNIMPVKLIDLTPSGAYVSLWEGDPRRGGWEVMAARRPVRAMPFTRVDAITLDPADDAVYIGRHVTHAVVCGRVLPLLDDDYGPYDPVVRKVDPSTPQDWSAERIATELRFAGPQPRNWA